MTEQNKIWFDQLVKDREDSAKTLEKPSMRGVKSSVVDKYSDQAHFIYELLQNANDAKATTSTFKLTFEGLYFTHNGTVGFNVSDPNTEEEDKEKNLLGHINSITSIANSNKTESSVGKFGVGFKAVFQYTETPHIYDPNFQFKISRFIVPVKLEEDLPDRKDDETVFYFPFDKNGISKEAAYKDILNKLKRLVYPTLFLPNLKEVSWTANEETGKYSNNIKLSKQSNDIIYKKLELYQEINSNITQENVLLLKRTISSENLDYSIGYFLDKEGKLIPKSLSAFCFFPTKKETNLNFIIHAPFLLTDSREGINDSKNHNKEMGKLLAQLAADSLFIIKDLGLLDDNIIKIIPYEKPNEKDLFEPFYHAIKNQFKTEELLPAKDGSYVKKENAYWASVPKLAELFSNKQLTDILGEEETNKWVFTSMGRGDVLGTDKCLSDYIDSVTHTWLDEKRLLEGWSYGNGSKQNGVVSAFIEKQDNKWLYSFYKWIFDTEGRKKLAKYKPFFLNQKRKAVSAFDENNKLQLFLPDNDGEGYNTLNIDLFNETNILEIEAKKQAKKSKQEVAADNTLPAKQFYEKFGLREYTVADEIEDAITRFQKQHLAASLFFAKAFKYFKNECPQEEINKFISKINKFRFIPYFTPENNNGESYGSDLLYPTEKLIEFYQQKPSTKFVDLKKLHDKYPNDHKTLDDFLKKLGVQDKDPDLKDEIFKIILPQYATNEGINTEPHFKKLFKYYKECPNYELQGYINSIKDKAFLRYSTKSNEQVFRGIARDIYFPSNELCRYFENTLDTKFLDKTFYDKLTDEKDKQILKEFLLEIGVSEVPRIDEKKTDSYYKTEKIFTLDGCHSFIYSIDTLHKSLIMWNILNQISFKELQKLKNCEISERPDGRYNFSTRKVNSPDLVQMQTAKWLVTQNGNFVAPNEITIDELAENYERNDDLEKLLGFKPVVVLTKEQRIAQKFKSEEEAELAKKLLEDYKAKQNASPLNTNSNRSNANNSSLRNTNIDDNEPSTSVIDKTIKDLDGLQKTLIPKEQTTHEESNKLAVKGEINIDEDAELAKGVEMLKKQLEIKKNRVNLVECINDTKKYSYEWFKAYLELLTTYVEKQSTTTQKSISFQEIKPYKADNKYFLLCGASNYISPEIESAEDFKISLIFKHEKKENIVVEGVSKKGQDLLIYCRESLPNYILSRLSNVFKVEINFTPIIDLLERLSKAFANREYINEWDDIQEAMPSLNYIYGPPGTGKTTTLCNEINTLLEENPNAKFLVLTPTNKAADVVCKKLCTNNRDLAISIVRLSRPTDPELEEYGIYRDTLEAETMQSINVVASTIHRLPYFGIQNESLLFEYPWDYVIFDESSMTGLHYITFAIMALFKTNENTKFIIAGDPKQIPPVVEINDTELENFDFQDENIYRMMGLESFKSDEQIIRDIDTIQNLGTQYRSIPQIGQLFSDLSYSSLLKHDRATNRKDCKLLPKKISNLITSNVTFIDIPLDKDNSIYKINKLVYSSYQTYCAILVAEIIKYFDNAVDNKSWTIGLIAPYKAQAILLNKLVTSYGISENVKVYSDTVHGFQGDECDIVFFVCNPNNYYYTGHEKSLLSKEYIYNVAISRAKDYLVVLYPYSKIIDNPFIKAIHSSSDKPFGNTKIVNSKEIEKVLFNEENYIENNSYVSGHDNVNVFGISEMKYFIKSNDTAIDIQLGNLQKKK